MAMASPSLEPPLVWPVLAGAAEAEEEEETAVVAVVVVSPSGPHTHLVV